MVEHAKAAGCRPLGVEGEEDGEWVLVDLGDVIVHLMQPEVRVLYDLERLWSLSPGRLSHRRMKIELIAAGTKPPGWVREGFDTYQGRMKGRLRAHLERVSSCETAQDGIDR